MAEMRQRRAAGPVSVETVDEPGDSEAAVTAATVLVAATVAMAGWADCCAALAETAVTVATPWSAQEVRVATGALRDVRPWRHLARVPAL